MINKNQILNIIKRIYNSKKQLCQIIKYLGTAVLGVFIGLSGQDYYTSMKSRLADQRITRNNFEKIEVTKIVDKDYEKAKNIILDKLGLNNDDILGIDIYSTSLSSEKNEDFIFYLTFNYMKYDLIKNGEYGLVIKENEHYILSFVENYYVEYVQLVPFCHNNEKYILRTDVAGSGSYLTADVYKINEIKQLSLLQTLGSFQSGGVYFLDSHFYISGDYMHYIVEMNKKEARLKKVDLSNYYTHTLNSHYLIVEEYKKDLRVFFDNKLVRMTLEEENSFYKHYTNNEPIKIELGDIVYVDTKMKKNKIFKILLDKNIKWTTDFLDYFTLVNQGESSIHINSWNSNGYEIKVVME